MGKDKRIEFLERAYNLNKILHGEITAREVINDVQHGVINSRGIRLYIPETELGVQESVDNKIATLFGVPIEYVIYKVENNRFFVSRKKAMEIRRKQWENKIKVGDKLYGTIVGISPKNAFIYLFGYEIPLKAEDLTWNYYNDIRRIFKLGDRVDCIVKSKNPPYVSVKEAYPNPWDTPPVVKPEDVLVCEVDAIAPFGILVKLPDGKQALCPPFSTAREMPTIGSKVVVTIKEVRVEDKRIFGLISRILR